MEFILKRVISFFTKICERYLPNAFVFCLLLTLFVMSAGLFLTPFGPVKLISFWGKNFWSLNSFSMQMVFILLTGQMIATSPIVEKMIQRLILFVKTEKQALFLISLFSLLMSWINWGLGLVLSALFARQLAVKLKKVNFALFIATAYSGFLVWHGGLSGTIPLKIAGDDSIFKQIYPDLSLPLSETLFSSLNISILIALLVIMPCLSLLMRTDKKTEIFFEDEQNFTPSLSHNWATRLENSSILNPLLFFLMMFYFVSTRPSIDINTINFIFLSLALLLQGTPRRFLWALQSAIKETSGIVIQFPFYAGMMGLMKDSGLADDIASWFVSISTSQTLSLFTFYSAGIVNFFVPSGGGQWVIQGPIMLKAAKELSAEPYKICLALAWGDAWSNLVQPFWAIPLLSLARLQLKDIMGYCLVFTLFSGVVIPLMIFLF